MPVSLYVTALGSASAKGTWVCSTRQRVRVVLPFTAG